MRLPLAMVLLAAASALGPGGAAGQVGQASYRLVEGRASVERGGVADAALEGGPLLTGDRLTTARWARVEVVLADTTVIHVAAGSDVVFDRLGELAGDHEPANVLLLERGALLVATPRGTGTRIDTEETSLYLAAGSHRVERVKAGTLVIARSGDAEVRTRRTAVWLSSGEEAWVEDAGIPIVQSARGADALERWAGAVVGGRERARVPRGSWLRALWTFFDEEDGGPEPASEDFASDTWDGEGTGCTDCSGRAGAAATRPPRAPEEPRHAVPVGPDGAAVPDRTSTGDDPDPVDDAAPDGEDEATDPAPVEGPGDGARDPGEASPRRDAGPEPNR